MWWLNTIFDIKVALASPLFNAAYQIACEAHEKQYRKDGKPYITHIDAVIIGTYNRCVELNLTQLSTAITCSIAALHDTYEDHPNVFNLSSIKNRLYAAIDSECPGDEINWNDAISYLLGGIVAISKKPKGEEDYHVYVQRVMSHKSATIVKIQDLMHNMSTLNDGNLLQKYQLTLWILQGQNTHISSL